MLELLLATPAHYLVAALFIAVIVAVIMVARLRAALWVIGAMLFLSSITLAIEFNEEVFRTWLFMLQLYRTPLFAACGFALLVSTIGHLGRIRINTVSPQGMMLLAIALWAAVVVTMHEGLSTAAQSFFFALLTILPVILILSALIRTIDDCYSVVRTILWVAMAWLFAVAVQFVVNRNHVIIGAGQRFIGMVGNPQFAAVLVATMSFTAMWAGLNDTRMRWRPFWLFLAAVYALLLAWTGSRTGMGMWTLGMVAVCWRRVGRAILLAPVVLVIGFFVYDFALSQNIAFRFDRLTSTSDTRSVVWNNLWRSAMESPIVGVGPANIVGSENSYLRVFATYGISVLFLLLFFTAVAFWQVFKLWRARPYLPARHRPFADLILGFHLAYFFGANFEGYIEARVASMLVFMLLFAQINRTLIRIAEARRHAWQEAGVAEAALDFDENELVLESPDHAPDDSRDPRHGIGHATA